MVLSFVSNGCLLTAAVLLSWKAAMGGHGVGAVLAYITTLSQATICVTTILGWMASLSRAKSSIGRLQSILEIPEEEKRREADGNAAEHISFRNLSYAYDGEKSVINHLDLEFRKGNVYQIIGESGSGKTTLLKLLMSLYASEEAEITVDRNAVDSIQNLIGYVPANPSLFNTTIYENIVMGDEISKVKCYLRAKELGVYEWIDSLEDGLDHMVDKSASNLSGGQKQAIAILRVLVRDCPVMILDEPFSALDKEKEEKLVQIIRQLGKDRIVILTSHRDCLQGEQIHNVVLGT